MKKYQLYIDGTWRDSVNGETIHSVNPSNGEILAEVPRGDHRGVHLAVTAAKEAFENIEWKEMLPHQRGKLLLRMAEIIREKKEVLAEWETLDNGKPLVQPLTDVQVAARYCEYYAGVADKILGETIPVRPDILDYSLREH